MKIYVLVQVSKGSGKKYIYDEKFELPKLEIILNKNSPGDYGIIPKAHSVYGLGCFVFSDEPSLSCSLIPAKVVGALRIKYGKIIDDEIIAVPINSKIKNISEISKQKLKQAIDFIKHLKYKETGKIVKLKSIKDKEKAEKIVSHAVELYKRIGE